MSAFHPAFDPASAHPAAQWLVSANIRNVTADSRAVDAACAFVAYPGVSADGRKFIADAVKRGAAAILWDPEGGFTLADCPVPHLAVPDLKRQISRIAGDLFGRPSEDLLMVGVTGTNGKTSTSTWIAESLTDCGRKAGVIGTLGAGFPGQLIESGNTTPDAIVVQRSLANLRAAGAEACAMEVSSHGLDQHRVDGVKFTIALFTNLTRDHLDYHGSMDAYGAAKAKLFSMPGLKHAVINIDDAFGQKLALDCAKRGVRTLTHGIGTGDIAAHIERMDGSGFELKVKTPRGDANIRSTLVGHFNVLNLLGVLGVLLAAGVPLPKAAEAAAARRPVAGRMQVVGGPAARKPTVVIDYAHTPDALEKALSALKPTVAAGHRLFCVFGCGGDRDRGKRPVMGEIASRLANRVIVTSDNPRSEPAHQILDDIIAGMGGAGGADRLVIEDRRAAIFAALREAAPGDVVLIAGKGHEPYQDIKGVKHPFSDLAVAGEALEKFASGGKA
ncbi:MAG: UDP-N-acetylmuramoyl-L-alanyl-D-glutamate--2,6-diaminopimelate ligase [Betaproteobacteria bacterium]|nr:UDP-N-acetylmuramoyl-L-alanyl-D-glutamate--2,6-diaminopimelate ligase [Betaproteobacteria bacterium]